MKTAAVLFPFFILTILLPLSLAEASVQLQWSYKAGSEISQVEISDDGSQIVAASDILYFFTRENDQPRWTSSLAGLAAALDMTPNGQYIAVAAYDKVYLFDNTGNKFFESYLKEEGQGEMPGTSVDDVAVSDDGNYVAAVGAYSVNLFSKSGQRLWYSYGNPIDPGSTTAVAISSDGSYIAVGDYYGALSLFDTNGSLLGTVSVSSDYGIEDIEIVGSYLVAVVYDAVKLFSLPSLTEVWSYSLSAGEDAEVTADASLVVVADFDQGVFAFTMSSSTPLWQKSLSGVNAVSVSSDGNYVAVAANDGVYVLSGSDGSELGRYSTVDVVEDADVSRNLYVVAGTYTKDVLFFSANNSPVLSSGSVSPTAGDENTTFAYRVTYRDADGDPPSYVTVYINDTPHEMQSTGTEYQSGVVFEFSTTLSAGSHLYYFEAMDSRGAKARYPADGYLSGPTVVAGGEGGAPEAGGEGAPSTGGGIPVAPVAAGVVIMILVVVLLAKKLGTGTARGI